MKPTPELSGVLAQWDKAEKAIKIAEQITGRVAIPSVMELRYAGRRVVDSFNVYALQENEEEARQYLIDAKFDCLRAQHDALDISVNYIASFVDEVLQKTEPFALEGHYDELSSFIDIVGDLQEQVRLSRADRVNREKYYDSVHDDLIALQSRFQKFKTDLVGMIEATDVYFHHNPQRTQVVQIAAKAERERKRFLQMIAFVTVFTIMLFFLMGVLGL